MRRPPGQSDRAFLEAELPGTLTRAGEIAACATVSGTFFAAVRQRDTGRVWALVVLIRRDPGTAGFAYKDIRETEGPADTRCPARILDLLTPTSHPEASEWRQRCRRTAARAARARAVRPGTTVRFTRPLRFSDGTEHQDLVLESRSTFRTPAGSQRYRIPHWRTDYDYQAQAGQAP